MAISLSAAQPHTVALAGKPLFSDGITLSTLRRAKTLSHNFILLQNQHTVEMQNIFQFVETLQPPEIGKRCLVWTVQHIPMFSPIPSGASPVNARTISIRQKSKQHTGGRQSQTAQSIRHQKNNRLWRASSKGVLLIMVCHNPYRSPTSVRHFSHGTPTNTPQRSLRQNRSTCQPTTSPRCFPHLCNLHPCIGRYETAAIAAFISMLRTVAIGAYAADQQPKRSGAARQLFADMVSASALFCSDCLQMAAGSSATGYSVASSTAPALPPSLALFNTLIGKADKRWFIGVPSPDCRRADCSADGQPQRRKFPAVHWWHWASNT